MKKIDLGAKPPTNKLLEGAMPIPVGRPVKLRSPSPGERAVLEEAGWKDGDPVPENYHEIREAVIREATDTEHMPLPGDIKTPPLVMPDEVDITDLSPDKQAKYQDILQRAMRAARDEQAQDEAIEESLVKGAGQGVNAAIRAAQGQGDKLEVEDDRKADTYATGTAKPLVPPAVATPRKTCSRCGFPADMGDVVEVTESDKLNFLQSLLGLVPFMRTYKLFGGNLVVTVRSLSPYEVDACFRQIYFDGKYGRVVTHIDEQENLIRYRAALQLVEIHGPNLQLTMPKSLKEWEAALSKNQRKGEESDDTVIKSVWDRFVEQIDHSESLHRTLISTVGLFNQLVLKMEANSENPDFWKATDTPTS